MTETQVRQLREHTASQLSTGDTVLLRTAEDMRENDLFTGSHIVSTITERLGRVARVRTKCESNITLDFWGTVDGSFISDARTWGAHVVASKIILGIPAFTGLDGPEPGQQVLLKSKEYLREHQGRYPTVNDAMLSEYAGKTLTVTSIGRRRPSDTVEYTFFAEDTSWTWADWMIEGVLVPLSTDTSQSAASQSSASHMRISVEPSNESVHEESLARYVHSLQRNMSTDETKAPEATSFLKLGDHLYALNRISTDGLKLETELRDYYESRIEALRSRLSDALGNYSRADRQSQLTHLRRYAERGDVRVATSMYDKPLTVSSSSPVVHELKIVTWAPDRVIVRGDQLDDYLSDAQMREYDVEDDSGITYMVRVKAPFAVPLALYKHAGTIYTPFVRTPHTGSGHNVCIGSMTADHVWALTHEELEDLFNRINMLSPMTDSLRVPDYGISMNVDDLYSNIVSIEQRDRQREGIWSVDSDEDE